MRIIDLLNKIANGEEIPKKIRIDHWCYKFEWVEHLENYYDDDNDIDIMSALSMSKEELNYKVEIIEENQNIKELWIDDSGYIHTELGSWRGRKMDIAFATKINEVIKEVNKQKNNEEVL